jgi:hypothetical protein
MRYRSMEGLFHCDRRGFLKLGGAVGAGMLLGRPEAWAAEEAPAEPATNIDKALAAPRTATSLPGAQPGRVVEVHDAAAIAAGTADAAVVAAMFRRGLAALTGLDAAGSFKRLFTPSDVVGIKVNPVGAGLISTHLELVDAVIAWLTGNGLPRANIVIWDRFDVMLTEAGFTAERFPGVGIEGLQTMDEKAFEEGADQSGWLKADGRHVSADNFDSEVIYWADAPAPSDQNYLHQHVFNDLRSPFGKLVTQRLTKIINLSVFKNTGNGISMATKNLGYGAICNTGRLHQPLFFKVCTEVLAFPVLRDKLVLNVTEGLVGQYDGGPMGNAAFSFDYQRLFLATDPFALDRVCHDLMVAKRKEMGVAVNEHPRYTDYLRYAETLGLGIADPARIEHLQA